MMRKSTGGRIATKEIATKEGYLKELEKHLRRLPEADRNDAMEYFREYFEEVSDAAGETRDGATAGAVQVDENADAAQKGDDALMQKVLRELGTPKEAAAEVMARLLDEQLIDSRNRGNGIDGKHGKVEKAGEPKRTIFSVGRNTSLAILAICVAPVGLPLLAAALLLVLAGILVALSIVICGFAGGLALICMAGKLLIRGIMAMVVSFSGGLMLAGVAVIWAGCALLLFVLTVFCCKWIGRGIAVLAKRMVERGRRK